MKNSLTVDHVSDVMKENYWEKSGLGSILFVNCGWTATAGCCT